jgi:hypothetical protein
MARSIGQSVNRSIGQSVNRSIGQSVNRSIGQSVNQEADFQNTTKSIDPAISAGITGFEAEMLLARRNTGSIEADAAKLGKSAKGKNPKARSIEDAAAALGKTPKKK